jgi:hypothetical protein
MPCLTTIDVPRSESPMLTYAAYPLKKSKSVYMTSCNAMISILFLCKKEFNRCRFKGDHAPFMLSVAIVTEIEVLPV